MASKHVSFLDGLSEHVATEIIQWFKDHDYDSDGVIQDVLQINDGDSNIGSVFDEHPDLKKLSDFVSSNATPDVKVIGISGATRSGKSQLTKRVLSALAEDECQSIHQDAYFDTVKIYGKKLNGNWDHPDAINHDLFLDKVTSTIAAKKRAAPDLYGKRCWIILEGFMLFHDCRIVEYIDYFVWLEIERKICYQRRMATKKESKKYFKDWLWPNHVEYKHKVFGSDGGNSTLSSRDSFISIDGNLSYQECLCATLRHIGASQ